MFFQVIVNMLHLIDRQVSASKILIDIIHIKSALFAFPQFDKLFQIF